MIKIFLILACLSFLIGCNLTDPGQTLLERYSSNVGNLVQAEPAHFESSLIAYPSKRDLFQQTEEIRTGFFDLFTLGKCNLQELIAEKNNAMGKVMPASRLLYWEHQFLVRILKCRQGMGQQQNPDQEFMAKLDSIIIIKKANLPLVYWNATFASPEFQRLFSLAGRSLSPSLKKSNLQPAWEALTYLSEIGSSLGEKGAAVEISEIEKNIYYLQKDRIAGSLLHSVEQLTFYLTQVSDNLDIYKNINIESISDADRDQLIRIYQENYRLEVQPYLSAVHQVGDHILRNIAQLYQQQRIEVPDSFESYYQYQLSIENPSGLWQRFQEAIRRHNISWQRVIDTYQLRAFD